MSNETPSEAAIRNVGGHMVDEFSMIREGLMLGDLSDPVVKKALTAMIEVQFEVFGLLNNVGEGKFVTLREWWPYKRGIAIAGGAMLAIFIPVASALLVKVWS